MTEQTHTDTTFAVRGRLQWQSWSLVALGVGAVLSFVAQNLAPASMVPGVTAVVAVVFALLPMKRPVVRTVVAGIVIYSAYAWTESFVLAPINDGTSEIIALYRLLAYSGLVLVAGGSWISAWTFERVRQARLAQRWANVTWHARANGHRLMWVLALGGRTRSSMKALLQDMNTGYEENASVWGNPIPGTYVVLTPQRRIETVLTVAEQKAYDKWARRTA